VVIQSLSREVIRKAAFLDRDGVLNAPIMQDGKTYAPTSFDEFIIIPGAAKAVQNLHDAGYLIIVVTNQPDISTGKVEIETVSGFHEHLHSMMPIDEIYVCSHVNENDCECRKPKPGMILAAAEKYRIDLTKSVLIGDRWRDIDAAHAAGCASFFIDYGYNESLNQEPNFIVTNLAEAAEIILTQN